MWSKGDEGGSGVCGAYVEGGCEMIMIAVLAQPHRNKILKRETQLGFDRAGQRRGEKP